MTVFSEQPSSAGRLPSAPFDLSSPDPAKPAVAQPIYELVPCWVCLLVALGSVKLEGMTCACKGAHYVRVNPELCPILTPTVTP